MIQGVRLFGLVGLGYRLGLWHVGFLVYLEDHGTQ